MFGCHIRIAAHYRQAMGQAGERQPAAAAAAFAAARPGFPRDPASCASGSSSPSEASAFTFGCS